MRPDVGAPAPQNPVLREISEADFGKVAAFLAAGFGYEPSFYLTLFDKLRAREPPARLPRYGYYLSNSGTVVGCLLLIVSKIEANGVTGIRCHVTSWCVDPAYRPLASAYFARGLKLKDVTYINVSARSWTRSIIENQGFRKYSTGQFLTSTLINATRRAPANVVLFGPEDALPVDVDDFERTLLLDHAGYGCISVWCIEGKRAYPFVFQCRPFKRIIPGVQLAYSHNVESFVRFARPLGRYLFGKGKLLIRIDANRAIDGLTGKYVDDLDPRFYKGEEPRLGDLAYTQMVMCPFTRSRTAS